MTDVPNVLYGGPDIELVEADSRSLGEVVQRLLRRQEDSSVVVVDSSSGATLSTAQLRQRSVRLAECLRAAGVVAGDVIGVCSENRTEFPVAVFGSFLLGATVAPLNTSYVKQELQHAVNLSKPKIIFASAATFQRIVDSAQHNRYIQKVICFDAIQPSKSSKRLQTTLTEFLQNKSVPSSPEFDCVPMNMHTTNALILCSSGTTGLPKGVQLTQNNIHAAISQLNQGSEIMGQMGLEMNGLVVIPWFHTYGINILIGLTLCGRKIVTMARYEDRAFLQAIQDHKCDILFGVPPLIVMLAKSPLVDQYDLSCLKIIYSGAAPLSKEVANATSERIPSILGVLQGFGMSEMTLSVLQQSPVYCTAGSVGVLRPGIWGKIVEPDTGIVLGPDQRGEMCFKGSAVMRGYIGDEKATRGTIDPEGWLHTGDIGYYSEEGEWFIVDRLKELIKYKGFQVPPAELEAVLLTHPDITDAGVIGIPDEAVGEKAKGFVVKRIGSNLTPAIVEAFVADKMSYAKRLHGGVQLVAEIPKNQTGKILRRELRALQKTLKSKL